jgi:phosphoribosylformimino-5-aminoimidazole carboxamide ribotide isomerase
MRIIPAIDLIHGQCVRLVRGDFNSVSEYDNPPEQIAQQYIANGFSRIHIVDLEGAKKGKVKQWETLSKIMSVRGIEAQIGGGVRTEEAIERLLSLGVKQVVVGSVAMRSPETVLSWAQKFGPEKFCIAMDLQEGVLSASGWTKKETSTLEEILSKLEPSGIVDYLCTDITKDGTLEGPNFELYRILAQAHPKVRWIASGGVSSLKDLDMLRQTGVASVVIGKALYEGKITIEELVHYSKTKC